MQLNPRRPPGHGRRKALRYAGEVRRLRAEGHSLNAIRLALLDAGISVSVSTVRREVAHPPSQWELEHPDHVWSAPAEVPHEVPHEVPDEAPAKPQPGTVAETVTTRPPEPVDLSSAPAAVPTGLLPGVLAAMRRLLRTR